MQKARAGGEQRPTIQREPVTEDMAKMIASQKNIVDFNYMVSANGTAKGFKPPTAEVGQTAGAGLLIYYPQLQ